MERIALIGACGFVGTHLAIFFSSQGHPILLIDLVPLPSNLALLANIEFARIDLQNYDILDEHFSRFKPDIVISIAGWGMSTFDMLDKRCWTVNYTGTENLLKLVKKNNIKRFIYTSTYNVVFYGQKIEGGNERMPYAPLSRHSDEYSKSKTEAEKLVLQYNGLQLETGEILLTSIIRPGAIYGDDEQRHIPRIVKFIDIGLYSLFTVGNANVDWVHIDNLVRVTVFIIKNNK
jgi:nucleoside-diphosphate-sugar epimerase